MADWHWVAPWWLLLLPLPWLWLKYAHQQSTVTPGMAMRYPPLPQTPEASPTPTSRWPKRGFAMALLCWIIALAQPVQMRAPIIDKAQSEPVDAILVFGTSISMRLRDYVIDGQRIDRMSLAKHLTQDLVADYAGQRLGLVILGNPPALWLPFTNDKNVVRHSISRIRPVLSGRLTDMGATLKLIEQQFHADRETVVIMVTDGSLQLGQTAPEQAAKSLAAQGFTLYVLGMGSNQADAAQSQQGSLLYTPTDTDLLARVAKAGGGQFFHARNAEAFSLALKTIQAQHRRPVEPQQLPRLKTPWYPTLLIVGCLFFLASLTSPGWRWRTP